MPEYIYTNLPLYVRVTSRTEFSSSVVSSGSILLFSEDGSSLTAKLPDGSFVNVGGSGGTDVSSTTAEAGDVLSGKVFFTSGGVMTSGTIPTVSATLAANVTTVPSGYIASSQQLTVPEASSATVAGGIVTIPAGYVASAYTVSAGSGGATDYFKCATVTSGGSTWTGYKAVLTAGSYSFESVANSGLTYGSGFVPEVGKIYADGALVVVSDLFGIIPGDMVLYIPLSSSSAAAETGQSLTFGGSGFSYSTVDGIPCCYFSGAGYVDVGAENLPNGNFSVSYWVKFSGSEWGIIYTQPGMNTGAEETALTFGNYTAWGCPASANTAIWHHYAVTRDNDTIKVYLDGTLANSDTQSVYIEDYMCRLGAHNDYSDAYTFVGYLAGLRVYNRALSAAEIAALAAEFTPSV